MIKILNNFTGDYFEIRTTNKCLSSTEIKHLIDVYLPINDGYFFIMLDDKKIYSNIFDIKDDSDITYDCSSGLEFYIVKTLFIHNGVDYIQKILNCNKKVWYCYDTIIKRLYEDQSELLNNKNFIIFCSIHTFAIFYYMSENLKNDEIFIIELIKYNKRIINYISKELFKKFQVMNIIKNKYYEYFIPFEKVFRCQII
jgi:hypothetical protein